MRHVIVGLAAQPLMAGSGKSVNTSSWGAMDLLRKQPRLRQVRVRTPGESPCVAPDAAPRAAERQAVSRGRSI